MDTRGACYRGNAQIGLMEGCISNSAPACWENIASQMLKSCVVHGRVQGNRAKWYICVCMRAGKPRADAGQLGAIQQTRVSGALRLPASGCVIARWLLPRPVKERRDGGGSAGPAG